MTFLRTMALVITMFWLIVVVTFAAMWVLGVGDATMEAATIAREEAVFWMVAAILAGQLAPEGS